MTDPALLLAGARVALLVAAAAGAAASGSASAAATAGAVDPAAPPGLDPEDVTPGLQGFLATAAVVAACVLLILSLVRRMRRIRYRADREAAAEREQALAGASGGAGALPDGAVAAAVVPDPRDRLPDGPGDATGEGRGGEPGDRDPGEDGPGERRASS